jgi:hypothetical protein
MWYAAYGGLTGSGVSTSQSGLLDCRGLLTCFCQLSLKGLNPGHGMGL